VCPQRAGIERELEGRKIRSGVVECHPPEATLGCCVYRRGTSSQRRALWRHNAHTHTTSFCVEMLPPSLCVPHDTHNLFTTHTPPFIIFFASSPPTHWLNSHLHLISCSSLSGHKLSSLLLHHCQRGHHYRPFLHQAIPRAPECS